MERIILTNVPVSTQQTAFSYVAQLRSWLPREVGGVLWFGNDDGNMVAYTPIYCGNTTQPECYNTPGADAVTFSDRMHFGCAIGCQIWFIHAINRCSQP